MGPANFGIEKKEEGMKPGEALHSAAIYGAIQNQNLVVSGAAHDVVVVTEHAMYNHFDSLIKAIPIAQPAQQLNTVCQVNLEEGREWSPTLG